MAKTKAKPLPKTVREMMAEKSAVLTKAQAFEDVGMSQTALPLWLDGAQREEKLAPMLVEWYPKIASMLASQDFQPPKAFSVTIRPGEGVAATGGT